MTPSVARSVLISIVFFVCIGAGFWIHALWMTTRWTPPPAPPSTGTTVDTLQAAFVAVAERVRPRSEEHTSELQSRPHLVCRLLLEKKKKLITYTLTRERPI